MSSFTSYIPGYETPNMERLNPGRKRPAPSPRINDFAVAQRSQQNDMFFTDADDGDSLFGSDEPAVIEESNSRNRPSQTQTQSPRNGNTQNGRSPNSGGNVSVRNTFNGRTINPTNHNSTRRPASTTRGQPAPSRPVPETIQIKDEEIEPENTMDAEYIRNIPPPQRVKIFVGRKNRSIHVKRSDLSKSPTLQSYVVDDPIQGAFIMRPQLMTTHYDDFAAVAQFLRSGEYAPLILENAANPQGPKVLSGFKSDEDYARELVKAGKLYGLARGFGIQGMAGLVFRKVSEVDSGRYSIGSLVKVAEIVFRDGKEGVEMVGGGGSGLRDAGKGDDDGNGDGNGNANGEGTEGAATAGGTEDKDPLEEWIVGKLAYNFQEIMRIQREKFFEVVKMTGKKMLFSRVLEEVAAQYRASGGKLSEPVIELD